MILKLKSLTQGDKEISIDGTATVAELKEIIYQLEEIPPQQQRLVCSGSILGNNNSTLAQYKITSGNYIHMVLALRGG